MRQNWKLSGFAKVLFIGVIFFLLCFVVYTCKNPEISSDYSVIEPIAVHKSGAAFAGSTTCIPCHQDIYADHVKTTHYNTSGLADSSNIKGSFKVEKNTFILNNHVLFTLMKTDSGFYQRANFLHNQLELFTAPLDIVFGSGTKGQSYLSWKEDQLFQLQASYFTPANRWTSSPGLKELGSLRPVGLRCLECHSTFAKNTGKNGKGNHYDKAQIIYGIDCERCHGPSAKHVGYHQKNKEAKTAKYMSIYGEFSRKQRLDACALCHSGGGREPLQEPFSYLVGDDLDEFYGSDNEETGQALDVHSNQYGLLKRSACFKNSPKMDCTTCHNPHENERGNSELFNLKCMSCHSQSTISCNKGDTHANTSMTDCIACHMPLIPSKSMVVQVDSTKTAVKVRTHNIAIY
jgi:hypothetical protein